MLVPWFYSQRFLENWVNVQGALSCATKLEKFCFRTPWAVEGSGWSSPTSVILETQLRVSKLTSRRLGTSQTLYGTSKIPHPLRRCRGQGPHLATRWEPHSFSRVAAAFSSYDGELSLPLGLALGSPIFPSGCEGKLGVALESLQGLRDLT